MNSKPIPELTSIRGLAAFVVLIGHTTWFFTSSRTIVGLYSSGISVSVFFVLSGYLLARRERGYLDFLWGRAARTLPVHLVICAACLPLALGLRDWSAMVATVSLLGLPFGICNGGYNGPAWSLGAEWWAYLCWPLIIAAARTGRYLMIPALIFFLVASAPYHPGLIQVLRAFDGAFLGVAFCFMTNGSLPAIRVLRWRPLVWLGDISYPLYLVQWLVLVLLHGSGFNPYLAVGLVFPVTFALAALLHHTVEKPAEQWLRNAFHPPSGKKMTGLLISNHTSGLILNQDPMTTAEEEAEAAVFFR